MRSCLIDVFQFDAKFIKKYKRDDKYPLKFDVRGSIKTTSDYFSFLRWDKEKPDTLLTFLYMSFDSFSFVFLAFECFFDLYGSPAHKTRTNPGLPGTYPGPLRESQPTRNFDPI